MPEWLKKWAARHPASLVGWILGVILSLVTVLTKVGPLRSWFDQVLTAGTAVAPDHQIHAGRWLFLLALLLALVAVSCATLALQQWVLRKGQTPKAAQEALSQAMIAAEIIRNRSFPGPRQAIYALVKVKNTYYIYQNYDGEVHRHWEIRAVTEPVQFYAVDITVSGKAEAIDYSDGLELKVCDESDGTENEVVFLPTEISDYRRKKLLLAFVPPIHPSETKPRKIVLQYKWKGMWKQLQADKHETFEWPIESREAIPSIEFEMLLEPGADGKLDYEETGQKYPGSEINVIERKYGNNDVKWSGYRYTIPNGPAGLSTYSLRLKLLRPES